MAENTVKALTEARAKKIAELRDLNSQLNAKPDKSDPELTKRYNAADAELADIDEKLARARRIESLQDNTRAAGSVDLTGVEDRELTPGQRKDDPLIDTDAKGYRVLDAIAARLENRSLTGIHSEVQQRMEELNRSQNRSAPRGILIPMNLRCDLHAARRHASAIGARQEQRDLNLSGGAGVVPTIVAPTMIELLRKRVLVQRLGAMIMSDMVGNFALPKETAEPTWEWVAEGSAASESQGTIGQVSFTAKTVTAWTELTRQFIKQASLDAEMFTRFQLINGQARAVDYGALAGPGTSNNVSGITTDTDVPIVAIGTNGGALTWAKIVEFWSKVASYSADAETMAYVVNAVTSGSMRTTVKVSGYPVFLEENGMTNGYPVAVTNQLPSNLSKGSASGTLSSMCFGDFSKLIIAMWGGLDILVDPYSQSTTGKVRVIGHTDCDINRTYDEAFSRCVDVLP